MFYWQAKSSAKTPQIHNLRGVKMAFIYPKDDMDKNFLKSSPGVHWTLKWRRVTLGSANPPTVRNFRFSSQAATCPPVYHTR